MLAHAAGRALVPRKQIPSVVSVASRTSSQCASQVLSRPRLFNTKKCHVLTLQTAPAWLATACCDSSSSGSAPASQYTTHLRHAIRIVPHFAAAARTPELLSGLERGCRRKYGALRRNFEDGREDNLEMERLAVQKGVHGHTCSNSPRAGKLKPKAKSKSRSSGRRPDARVAQTGKLVLQRNLEQQIRRRERKSKQHWEEPDEPAQTSPVLLAIVGANCVVFFLWQSTYIRRFMGKHFALSSAGVLKEGRYHTLITSIFSHYDPLHLGANMGCLIFFGKEVIAILGPTRFVALFVASGLVSSMAQVVWPLVAPRQSRYSQYQLGLGARQVSATGALFRLHRQLGCLQRARIAPCPPCSGMEAHSPAYRRASLSVSSLLPLPANLPEPARPEGTHETYLGWSLTTGLGVQRRGECGGSLQHPHISWTHLDALRGAADAGDCSRSRLPRQRRRGHFCRCCRPVC